MLRLRPTRFNSVPRFAHTGAILYGAVLSWIVAELAAASDHSRFGLAMAVLFAGCGSAAFVAVRLHLRMQGRPVSRAALVSEGRAALSCIGIGFALMAGGLGVALA